MPMVPPLTSTPNEVVSDRTVHFDYPGSDIILRSWDSHDFRVPQLYLVTSSPVLRELIQGVPSTSDVSESEDSEEQKRLPVVKLPESGAILYSLLTFIFPVAPVLPSATENIMKLLSVAQKYQIDSVLIHVRGAIALHDPPLIRPETALHVYFLAQRYELHQEVLRAARVTLRLTMTVEDLEGKIDFMPGAYLRELWKYYERVKKDLALSLLGFKKFGVPDIVKDLRWGTPPSDTPIPIPQWLDDYIESLAQVPHLFDVVEFENAWIRHIKDGPYSSASSQDIRVFWEALKTVVDGTIEKADSSLALVKEEPTPEIPGPPFVPLCLNVPDADIIVRSSDQVNFRVHKSLLAMSSPFFNDLLSLPQPPDGELVDGLPVIQLSEDAEMLDALVSLLYPVASVIPSSYEKVFALLAACQKYDMLSIQSNIRAEVKRGTFPAPAGTEAFRAYAIASSMGLVPEMESAARLTLGYPMTFESLGEGLRSFEGRALRDLVRYRKRCRDNFVSCLDTFFDVHSRCQIWDSCEVKSLPRNSRSTLTRWLRDFFTSKSDEPKKGFTHAIFSTSNVLEGYLVALKNHTYSDDCNSCIRVHMEGQTFYRELEDELAQALDKDSVML